MAKLINILLIAALFAFSIALNDDRNTILRLSVEVQALKNDSQSYKARLGFLEQSYFLQKEKIKFYEEVFRK